MVCYYQAYRHGYYGSEYVWWFPGLYDSTWWDPAIRDHNCTAEELFTVLQNSSFYTIPHIYSTSNIPGISGKVYQSISI